MIIPELKIAVESLKEQLKSIPDNDVFFDLVKKALVIFGETNTDKTPRQTLEEYLSLYTQVKSKEDLLTSNQEKAILKKALAPMMDHYGISIPNNTNNTRRNNISINGGTRRKQRGGWRRLLALLLALAAGVMGRSPHPNLGGNRMPRGPAVAAWINGIVPEQPLPQPPADDDEDWNVAQPAPAPMPTPMPPRAPMPDPMPTPESPPDGFFDPEDFSDWWADQTPTQKAKWIKNYQKKAIRDGHRSHGLDGEGLVRYYMTGISPAGAASSGAPAPPPSGAPAPPSFPPSVTPIPFPPSESPVPPVNNGPPSARPPYTSRGFPVLLPGLALAGSVYGAYTFGGPLRRGATRIVGDAAAQIVPAVRRIPNILSGAATRLARLFAVRQRQDAADLDNGVAAGEGNAGAAAVGPVENAAVVLRRRRIARQVAAEIAEANQAEAPLNIGNGVPQVIRDKRRELIAARGAFRVARHLAERAEGIREPALDRPPEIADLPGYTLLHTLEEVERAIIPTTAYEYRGNPPNIFIYVRNELLDNLRREMDAIPEGMRAQAGGVRGFNYDRTYDVTTPFDYAQIIEERLRRTVFTRSMDAIRAKPAAERNTTDKYLLDHDGERVAEEAAQVDTQRPQAELMAEAARRRAALAAAAAAEAAGQARPAVPDLRPPTLSTYVNAPPSKLTAQPPLPAGADPNEIEATACTVCREEPSDDRPIYKLHYHTITDEDRAGLAALIQERDAIQADRDGRAAVVEELQLVEEANEEAAAALVEGRAELAARENDLRDRNTRISEIEANHALINNNNDYICGGCIIAQLNNDIVHQTHKCYIKSCKRDLVNYQIYRALRSASNDERNTYNKDLFEALLDDGGVGNDGGVVANPEQKIDTYKYRLYGANDDMRDGFIAALQTAREGNAAAQVAVRAARDAAVAALHLLVLPEVPLQNPGETEDDYAERTRPIRAQRQQATLANRAAVGAARRGIPDADTLGLESSRALLGLLPNLRQQLTNINNAKAQLLLNPVTTLIANIHLDRATGLRRNADALEQRVATLAQELVALENGAVIQGEIFRLIDIEVQRINAERAPLLALKARLDLFAPEPIAPPDNVPMAERARINAENETRSFSNMYHHINIAPTHDAVYFCPYCGGAKRPGILGQACNWVTTAFDGFIEGGGGELPPHVCDNPAVGRVPTFPVGREICIVCGGPSGPQAHGHLNLVDGGHQHGYFFNAVRGDPDLQSASNRGCHDSGGGGIQESAARSLAFRDVFLRKMRADPVNFTITFRELAEAANSYAKVIRNQEADNGRNILARVNEAIRTGRWPEPVRPVIPDPPNRALIEANVRVRIAQSEAAATRAARGNVAAATAAATAAANPAAASLAAFNAVVASSDTTRRAAQTATAATSAAAWARLATAAGDAAADVVAANRATATPALIAAARAAVSAAVDAAARTAAAASNAAAADAAEAGRDTARATAASAAADAANPAAAAANAPARAAREAARAAAAAAVAAANPGGAVVVPGGHGGLVRAPSGNNAGRIQRREWLAAAQELANGLDNTVELYYQQGYGAVGHGGEVIDGIILEYTAREQQMETAVLNDETIVSAEEMTARITDFYVFEREVVNNQIRDGLALNGIVPIVLHNPNMMNVNHDGGRRTFKRNRRNRKKTFRARSKAYRARN